MSSNKPSFLHGIDMSRLPRHVAIIMDGNGRWAKKKRLPRLWGHRAGAKTVREIVEAAARLGISVLTLYAFSTENWTRPKTEIMGLMRLLFRTLRAETEELNRNNIQLETIGDISKLPAFVQSDLAKAKAQLAHNSGLKLILALNYGGRQDIIQSVNSLLKEGPGKATEELLERHLQTAGLPDPDLLIRTSGEMRVSNFLLWQIAYSEIFVTPTLWPDFKKEDFYRAIIDFQKRERRYGGIG